MELGNAGFDLIQVSEPSPFPAPHVRSLWMTRVRDSYEHKQPAMTAQSPMFS